MRALSVVLLTMLLVAPVWAQSVTARNQYKFARTFAERGDWKRALEEIDKAIKEDPHFADAVYLRALCHFGLEQYPEAEKDFKQTIEWNPDFFPAWQQLGNLYLATEQYDQAEKHFKSMMMVPRGAPVAHYCLGVLAYVRKDLSKAEKEWAEAVAADPKMARAHNNLGTLHLMSGRPQQALREFREANDLEKENPLYLVNLAWALADNDQPGMARLRLKEAQEEANERHDVGFTAAALVAYLDKDYEKVVKLSDLALQENKELVQAALLKARALEALDKKSEARLVYEEVLKSDPNIGEAEKALERLPKPEPEKTPETEEAPQTDETPAPEPVEPAPSETPQEK
ncbi:MAG: tetratricopeptide repeat protein [Candidatus Eremiobacteraeota bacterium]|nr:tetratricopeptide repeat protein [Candidatus Eremiobacteraeota bacterium]